MNIKDLIVPLALALVTTWAVNYFFLSRFRSQPQAQNESSFVAPVSEQTCRPLNKEIDFIDTTRPSNVVETNVEVPWASLLFSSDGASLQRLTFKRTLNNEQERITTIFPVGAMEKEQRAFLVALQEKTPYYYNLENRQDSDNTTELTYAAPIDGGGTLRKRFVIHHNHQKIDLDVSLDLSSGSIPHVTRIFFPAPLMPELGEKDQISGVVIDNRDTFTKTSIAKIELDRGWFNPELFGGENRYFVHAMVDDENQFVQRAYYTLMDKNKLFSILEGPEVTQSNSWKTSFYLGPKEIHAMSAVDPQLQKTLDYYGVFAPISKFLLMILNWLYKYIGNYGLAIIVLTLLIKIPLIPFTLRSQQGMEKQKEMQKKLAYLQKKYKDQPAVLAQERAELIKKHGLPGIGGCLPLLLQLPIFIALNRVLSNSIELYQAPMLWIKNLSVPDPYYILPILVFIALLAQASFADPKNRFPGIAMALVFGVVTANFPAGLSLYIAVSTLLSVLQTKLVKTFKLA